MRKLSVLIYIINLFSIIRTRAHSIPRFYSCDEQITDTLLTCITSYAVLCGQLNMCTPRDAFISAMCKGSLPPHYTLTVLTTIYQSSYISPRTVFEADSVVDMRPSLGPYLGSGGSLDGGSDIAPRTDQIVAVGTPLPTRSLPQGAHQGPVMVCILLPLRH